jgi:hypothetical protein
VHSIGGIVARQRENPLADQRCASSNDATKLQTFAVATTDTNELVGQVRDRIPLILADCLIAAEMIVAHHNVRFGSKADMTAGICDVCFTPKSGHRLSALACPLCATSRLMHCSKKHRYSITSSASANSDCGTLRPSAFATVRLRRN